jgi:hypothetical protein
MVVGERRCTADNLSAVYNEARSGDERYPSAEEVEDAFGDFMLARKA